MNPTYMDYAEVPAPGAWADSGACRGQAASSFFDFRGPVPVWIKELCADCPVRSECLDYALANNMHGVWAGTSWNQRRRMQGRKTWRM